MTDLEARGHLGGAPKCLAALTLLLFSAGCATVAPPVASYDTSSIYPAVSIVINDGVVNSSTAWTGYYMMTIVDQTSFVIKEELTKTGVFERVELNNPYQEVVLSVVFARKLVDDNFVKGMFQAGTLFLIPTTNELSTKAQISVRVRAETVKTYEYELQTTERVFLPEDSYGGTRAVAKSIWSSFLADAQKDKLFEEIVPESLSRQRRTLGSG